MAMKRRDVLRAVPVAIGAGALFCGNALGEASAGVETPPQTEPSKQKLDSTAAPSRETVAGIGGFFFRARDPKALSQWYTQHLGILPIPSSQEDKVWEQEAGPTAFAPFPQTTRYFGDAEKMWMINFRVRDLDRIVAQLREAGIEVNVDPQSDATGRFAHLKDPEGNPIELWQPAPKPAK